jgi:hypothetical protein
VKSRVSVLLAFLVALFIAPAAAFRVLDATGPVPLALLSAAFFAMAAWLGHTPESYALAEVVRATLRECGISQKEAAITMGIFESVLANWLNGKEQLSFWRLTLLGPEFMAALSKRMLRRYSPETVTVEAQGICDLVNAVQAMTASHRQPVMREGKVA